MGGVLQAAGAVPSLRAGVGRRQRPAAVHGPSDHDDRNLGLSRDRRSDPLHARAAGTAQPATEGPAPQARRGSRPRSPSLRRRSAATPTRAAVVARANRRGRPPSQPAASTARRKPRPSAAEPRARRHRAARRQGLVPEGRVSLQGSEAQVGSVPFLRVIRDKRGYETTYLMHCFATASVSVADPLRVPHAGGVRVGRDPLEPEVLRQIEAQYPDIAFDWQVVRENQQVIETARRAATPAAEARGREPAAASPRSAPAAAPAGRASASLASASHRHRHASRFPRRSRAPRRTSRSRFSRTGIRSSASGFRSGRRIRRGRRRCRAGRTAESRQLDRRRSDHRGLQQAAEALERLSHVFAKRRRTGRRRATETAPDARPDPIRHPLNPERVARRCRLAARDAGAVGAGPLHRCSTSSRR